MEASNWYWPETDVRFFVLVVVAYMRVLPNVWCEGGDCVFVGDIEGCSGGNVCY